MSKLNLGAAKLMHKYKAHAATSIGGFGLLGHAMTLARCQKNEVHKHNLYNKMSLKFETRPQHGWFHLKLYLVFRI